VKGKLNMQLKAKYETREQIPAEQQDFYIERDGAWHLDAEGLVDVQSTEQRLAELAAERNALTGERDALKARVEELQRVNHGAGAVGAIDIPIRGSNPFRRETFNLTRQGEIWRKDPARARALQSAAR
jgi:hypothetical protein